MRFYKWFCHNCERDIQIAPLDRPLKDVRYCTQCGARLHPQTPLATLTKCDNCATNYLPSFDACPACGTKG
jgi:rRNA maturation endonuclease Nob1